MENISQYIRYRSLKLRFFYLYSLPGRLIPVDSLVCCRSTYPCGANGGCEEEGTDDNARCV